MKRIMLPEPNETERVLMKRIQILMREEKVYTNPDYTLSHMAMQFRVRRTFIRDTIRKCMNRTLGAYMNEHRVVHAMNVMSRPGNMSLTLNAVARASGFGNQYHFCSVFKELTGLTPSEYKAYVARNNNEGKHLEHES